jgi:acyl-[acyl-carrier-protein]-phospholipid O-acyltransferase/long-chain-fatty-acid--[acyl-carrier-protein] ligase
LAEDVRGIEYSYGRLLMETLLLGRVAARLGEPGERVGLLLPNLVATVTLVIGLGVFRRVPALLNYTAGPEGLKHACRVARIRTVITSRAFVETARLQATVAALEPVRVCYLEALIALSRPLDKLWLLGYALWLPRTLGRDVAPEGPAVVLSPRAPRPSPRAWCSRTARCSPTSPRCGPLRNRGQDLQRTSRIPFLRSDHRGALAAGDRDPHLYLSEPAPLPRDPGAGL